MDEIETASIPTLPIKPDPIPVNPNNKKDIEEYISRTNIRKGFENVINNSECSAQLASEIGLAIEMLPTSEVISAKFGRWVREKREVPVKNKILALLFKKKRTVSVLCCSECGAPKKGCLKYCSNCGVKTEWNNLSEDEDDDGYIELNFGKQDKEATEEQGAVDDE